MKHTVKAMTSIPKEAEDILFALKIVMAEGIRCVYMV